MINKCVFSLAVTYVFSIISPTYAMESGRISPALQSIPSLTAQLEKVVKHIEQRKTQGQSVKMVLGAVNTECKRIEGDEWIFFDACYYGNRHDPLGKPYIQANFNNLEELSMIAKMIGPRLDQIVMDDSTFKFTQWKTDHIQLFANMLKESGDFIFPTNSIQYLKKAGDIDLPIKTDADIVPALKKINSFSLDSIPSCYSQIQGAWTTEKRAAFIQLMKEDPSNSALQYEFLIRAQQEMDTLCKNEIYYPHLRNVLNKSFENVRIEEDVPFVIKSSFGTTKGTLVWATNPKR